jgi:hypothetical protein
MYPPFLRRQILTKKMLEDPSTPAIIDEKTEDGSTALHIACQSGQVDVVSQLLGAGADATARDNEGWTPVHWAICFRQLEVLNTLLPLVGVSAPADDGSTTLHTSTYYADVEMTKRLVAFRADIWARDYRVRTTLTVAGSIANIRVLRILLAAMEKDRGLLSDEARRRIFDTANQEPEELCHELVRRYPKDWGFRDLLATYYLDMQNYASAAMQLDNLLELECPSNANAVIEELVHRRVYCDFCGGFPIVGLRHKCMVCPNFDLCNKCFQIEPHPDSPDHKYLTIPSEQWIQNRVQGVIVQ